MIIHLSHDKDGRWEILEPQEENMLLTRRIEIGRRLRAGIQVYELDVQLGPGKRRDRGQPIRLVPEE